MIQLTQEAGTYLNSFPDELRHICQINTLQCLHWKSIQVD